MDKNIQNTTLTSMVLELNYKTVYIQIVLIQISNKKKPGKLI